MHRIPQADLSGAFTRYNTIARRLGLIPDRMELALTKGNKTNGIAYRVHLTFKAEHWDDDDADTGHHNPPFGDDYLGMTAREACNALCDRARVAEDVAYRMHLGDVTAAYEGAVPGSVILRFTTPTMKDEAVGAFQRMIDAR